MTRENDLKDYWSFLERIQDAKDYVHQVMAQNAGLRRRLAELEAENRTLRAQRSTLTRLLRRSREEDQLLQYQLEAMRRPAQLAVATEAA